MILDLPPAVAPNKRATKLEGRGFIRRDKHRLQHAADQVGEKPADNRCHSPGKILPGAGINMVRRIACKTISGINMAKLKMSHPVWLLENAAKRLATSICQ